MREDTDSEEIARYLVSMVAYQFLRLAWHLLEKRGQMRERLDVEGVIYEINYGRNNDV